MEKTKHMGFERSILWATLLVLLLPTTTSLAQTPPADKGCIAYGYTVSERHFFLIESNASLFGNQVYVEHNCDMLEVFVDGKFTAGSSNNFNFEIEHGMHNLTFGLDNNRSILFDEVKFYPERLEWEFEWQQIESEKPSFIDAAKADIQLNWQSHFQL